MPSEYQSHGSDADRGEWRRRLQEDIGEDPARFLDRPLITPESKISSPFLLAKARIQGIDRLAVISAWKMAERRLGYEGIRDECPRERVLELLDDREQFLEEHGERPEDLQDLNEETPDRYWPLDRDVPEKTYIDRNSEGPSAKEKISKLRMAADGGDRDV